MTASVPLLESLDGDPCFRLLASVPFGRGVATSRALPLVVPVNYLGVTTAGFPNMFLVLGPIGPFSNLPPSIETQVEFIADLVREAERRGGALVEASTEAEQIWTATCNDVAHQTLFPKADSWIFGADIPGKTKAVMFYMDGLANHRAALAGVQAGDFDGFAFTRKPAPVLV